MEKQKKRQKKIWKRESKVGIFADPKRKNWGSILSS
jgi:hypothetical protein